MNGTADVPDTVANAVDALVDREGVDGAEEELQSRFVDGRDQDRVSAALSYLRREHLEEVSQ